MIAAWLVGGGDAVEVAHSWTYNQSRWLIERPVFLPLWRLASAGGDQGQDRSGR